MDKTTDNYTQIVKGVGAHMQYLSDIVNNLETTQYMTHEYSSKRIKNINYSLEHKKSMCTFDGVNYIERDYEILYINFISNEKQHSFAFDINFHTISISRDNYAIRGYLYISDAKYEERLELLNKATRMELALIVYDIILQNYKSKYNVQEDPLLKSIMDTLCD